jgi:hypothetical protein
MPGKKFSPKFTTIMLAIIFGLFAGVAGELLLRFYVYQDLYQMPYGNEVNLTDNSLNKSNLVISGAKKVVVNQDVMVQNAINSANNTFIGIFKKQTPDQATSTLSRADYYDLGQPALSALTLTGDGWLMANVPPGSALPAFITGYVAISRDKKIYQIDKVLDDRPDGLIFLHVADTRDLAVDNLAGFNDLAVGQMVVAVDWQGDAQLTEISTIKNKNELIRSSDQIDQQLILGDELEDNFKNAWVFDLGGNLVGLVDSKKNVRSIVDYRSLILNILKNRSLATPYFGVNYLDLSQTAKNDPASYGQTLAQTGAVIYPDATKIAVYKNSPAAAAGLQANDIIISVNSVNLDENNDLAEIVQNSLIGDTLSIKYMRAGQVKSADIVLGQK